MMFIRFGLFCLLSIASVPSVLANSGEESLQTYLQRYKHLSGQFTQIISSDQSNYTQSSTGEFWV